MGFLIVIGGLIAGIEGNKIVTNPAHNESPPETTSRSQTVNGTGNTVAGGDIVN
jgi:hypothetical protein